LALAFSPNCETLIAVSDKGTIHAFALATKVTSELWAPRAYAKFKLGKSELFEVAFATEQTFTVFTGSGVCYFMTLCDGVIGVKTTAVIEQKGPTVCLPKNVELP
jgi:hypothetical protein